GYGRHANRLAAHGHRVSGRDASPTFLARARLDAVQRGVEVDYREEDMRALSDVECFDGAICLFTAFGYFSDEENLDVLRRVRRALRPGGRFVLDVQNRDFIMAHFLRYIVHERPSGELMVDRNAFDPLTGRTSLRRSYVLHDRRVDGELSVRTYNLQELQWLFRDVGLTFEAAYGSWTKDEPGPDRPRLIVLGQRGAG
ncbi:MAG: class I SAM-dependent methyltransferase, partial [Planctomycetota bacterium]